MSVNSRRFVNMSVSRAKRNATNPVRDTVALYGAVTSNQGDPVTRYADWTTDWANVDNAIFISGVKQGNSYILKAEGIDKPLVLVTGSAAPRLYAYAKNFFDNGGVKLHVYVGEAAVKSDTGKINVGSRTIPDEEIAVASMSGAFDDESGIDALAKTYNATANPIGSGTPTLGTSATKVFVASTTDDKATSKNENVGLKYGELGIEMTVLAYLSRINAYGENTVHDYNFTIEYVDNFNVKNDDTLVGDLMAANINVDSLLSKAVRNIGGNLCTGHDIVNYYVTIVLQQTCEEAVINVLSDKLAGAEGTAVIYNTLVAELNKYVQCGLIAAGNWEDVDWIEEFNDESYTVVNAGERLSLGYKVLVIPFAALKQQQVSAHLCPPIFVAMTNQYGIRKVVINGEVR